MLGCAASHSRKLHTSVLCISMVCCCRIWAFSFQRNTQIKPIEALQWMKGNEEYYKVKYGKADE